MRLSWTFAVAVSIGIAGCGSESGVSLESFPGAYAQALCAQNFKCCSAADIGSNTMKDCVDTNQSSLQFLAGSISDAQSRGRVRYDKDKMKECVDAVAMISCDEWSVGYTMSSQPDICYQAVIPMVLTGGACRDDIECSTGNCQGEDPANNVDGVCAASDSTGLTCASSDECGPDFYCDATNVCAAKKFAGQACELHEECRTSCNLDTSVCSCYAGCAMAGPLTPGLLGLLVVAVLIVLASRRRRAV
jgi:hypothetical protein